MLLNWKESRQEVWAVCWFLYSFAKLLSMLLKGNVQITSSSWANTFPCILCFKVLLKIKFSFCMLKPFWWIDGEVLYTHHLDYVLCVEALYYTWVWVVSDCWSVNCISFYDTFVFLSWLHTQFIFNLIHHQICHQPLS